MIRHFKAQARYACLFGFFLLPSYGALVTYSDRAAFDNAAPDLPTETFAAGLVSPGQVSTCAGPISSATSNECFPAGGLLPGITYSSATGPMAVVGRGYPGLGNTTNLLGPNPFGSTLDLTFTPVSAIGFDIVAGPLPGNVVVTVRSTADTLLGSFTVLVSPGNGFFGLTSNTDRIGSMSIVSQAEIPAELIGNLSFGTITTATPEPCSFWLSGAGVAGVILWCWRKRRQGEIPHC